MSATQHTLTQLDKTILAIEKYETALKKMADAGEVEQHVYALFDGHFYTDNTVNYTDACFRLLRALAKPAIASAIQKEVGEVSYEELLEMLDKIATFCKAMDHENLRVQFFKYDLLNGDIQYKNTQLKEIELDYLVKIQGIISYDRLKEIAANDAVQ